MLGLKSAFPVSMGGRYRRDALTTAIDRLQNGGCAEKGPLPQILGTTVWVPRDPRVVECLIDALTKAGADGDRSDAVSRDRSLRRLIAELQDVRSELRERTS
jgi:hypothetical protein